MTTVGTGKYTYQVIENWAKLPAGQTFGNTSAVTTDSRDRVYVFQRKDPPVMIFDWEGNFLDSWGAGVITDPHGICIHDDIVYLTDRSDSVALKFTLEGKPLQILGDRGVHSDTGGERPGDLVPRAAGPFNYPTELVPSPSGDLYVSDGYRNARVHRFSGDGRLISSWGEPGKEGPNQFHCPTAYWWTRKRRCSSATGRITASRFSQPTGSSGRCGPTCAAPWTYPWTATAFSASVKARSAGCPHGSACWTSAATWWPAGTPTRPTAVGLTPTVTFTWPWAQWSGWTSTSGRDSPFVRQCHAGWGQV